MLLLTTVHAVVHEMLRRPLSAVPWVHGLLELLLGLKAAASAAPQALKAEFCQQTMLTACAALQGGLLDPQHETKKLLAARPFVLPCAAMAVQEVAILRPHGWAALRPDIEIRSCGVLVVSIERFVQSAY